MNNYTVKQSQSKTASASIRVRTNAGADWQIVLVSSIVLIETSRLMNGSNSFSVMIFCNSTGLKKLKSKVRSLLVIIQHKYLWEKNKLISASIVPV